MSRKIVRLTLDHLDELLPRPAGPACSGSWTNRRERAEALRREGRLGLRGAALGGSCGRVAVVDDVAVGYLIYARGVCPGQRVPDGAGAGRGAAHHGVVEPTAAGGGLGRMLVQGMARDLIERRIRRGGFRGHPAAEVRGAGGLPRQRGFKTHRAHGTTPRCDGLARRPWKDEVEAALERLPGAVRPLEARRCLARRPPGPVTKATRAPGALR